MRNFILGTLFGGGIVCGIYFGWLEFDIELFGATIQSAQLENASVKECRRQIKLANQRAFAADKIAQEQRNRAIEAERQLEALQNHQRTRYRQRQF